MPLTTSQAAKLLHVSASRVRQLVGDGKLRAVRFGARALQLDEADVREFRRGKNGRPRKNETV